MASVGRKVRNVWQRFLLPREVRRTIDEVRKRRLTYLSESRLLQLARLCCENEKARTPGLIIEAGCALGGSSAVICAAKNRDRKFLVYDVFGMIPAPSNKDGVDVHERFELIRSGKAKGIRDDLYYGYRSDLQEAVKNSLAAFGFPIELNKVSLVKGLLQDTLHVREAVSLAHIDVDWYEPVKTAIDRIEPNLVPGGSIVIDDYNDWSGCRRAVDDYMSTKPSSCYALNSSAGSLVITKVGYPLR